MEVGLCPMHTRSETGLWALVYKTELDYLLQISSPYAQKPSLITCHALLYVPRSGKIMAFLREATMGVSLGVSCIRMSGVTIYETA